MKYLNRVRRNFEENFRIQLDNGENRMYNMCSFENDCINWRESMSVIRDTTKTINVTAVVGASIAANKRHGGWDMCVSGSVLST